MSLIKTFVDAFKKASTAKSDGALEHARSDGVLGPTTGDAAGSFTPLRPAPAPSGDGAGGDFKVDETLGVSDGTSAGPISGGSKLPSTGPDQPTPPVGPVEGGDGPSTPGGGTPTPPSAPFNPNEVVFRTGAGTPVDFKVDDLPVAEDPDAGGELAKGKASPGDFKFTHTYDKASPVLAHESGDPAGGDGAPGGETDPLDVHRQVLDNSLADKLPAGAGNVLEDPDAGGEVSHHGVSPPPPGFDKLEGSSVSRLSSDPQEGGEVAGLRRPPDDLTSDPDDGHQLTGGIKVDGGPQVAFSADPQEGGEFTDLGKRASLKGIESPIDEGMKEAGEKADIATSASADPQEGGEFSGDHFNVKIEEVMHSTPATPPGVPLPYPNVGEADDGRSGFADAIARKSGEGQKDFLKVEMKEAFISREAPGVDGEATDKDHKIASLFSDGTSATHVSEPPPNLNAEESSFSDSLARKADGGQQDFGKVEMKDAVTASRIKFDGVEGESTHKDHKGEIELLRQDHAPDPSPPGPAGHGASSLLSERTDVKDSHDRYANLLSAQDPDTDIPDDDMPDSDFPDTDDHFESSTLLNLNADSDAHEMLPGLAGDLSDSLDVDFDLDPDADVDADTDESDL